MKLYYIFLSAGLKSDGVQKKVIAQIRALNNCGMNCHGLFFSSDVKELTKLTENINLIPFPDTNKRYFNAIYQKKTLLKFVSNYIENIIDSSDLIYLRYPGVTFELYKFSKKYKNRIISEHQAMEIDEIKSFKNEHPLGLKPSKLISYFLYQFWPIFNEKIWCKKYSEMLFAKVAVTHEIAEYHKKTCKIVWVIPNGIDTNQFRVRNVPIISDTIKILFLKGTSGIAPWNGIDRLVNSIDNFHDRKYKIELIICGNIVPDEIPKRDYISQMGFLDSKDLDMLFSEIHIGFSTLCLYRKNLNEAAVLKAREYFARGLPFVYGYKDPDFMDGDASDLYTLKVSNDNSCINFYEVIDFIEKVYIDQNHPQKMRQFAELNLDWNAKMLQLQAKLLQKK